MILKYLFPLICAIVLLLLGVLIMQWVEKRDEILLKFEGAENWQVEDVKELWVEPEDGQILTSIDGKPKWVYPKELLKEGP